MRCNTGRRRGSSKPFGCHAYNFRCLRVQRPQTQPAEITLPVNPPGNDDVRPGEFADGNGGNVIDLARHLKILFAPQAF
jgi:hypothetical protein